MSLALLALLRSFRLVDPEQTQDDEHGEKHSAGYQVEEGHADGEHDQQVERLEEAFEHVFLGNSYSVTPQFGRRQAIDVLRGFLCGAAILFAVQPWRSGSFEVS